jgi:hypothetical protein
MQLIETFSQIIEYAIFIEQAEGRFSRQALGCLEFFEAEHHKRTDIINMLVIHPVTPDILFGFRLAGRHKAHAGCGATTWYLPVQASDTTLNNKPYAVLP